MSLNKLLPTISQLSHQDKLRLIHFLILAVAKEEGYNLELAENSNLENAFLNQLVSIELDGITQELSNLITQFSEWKSQLVTDPNIMAGETVFPNSRLSVRRIGGMLERGESPTVIKEDYPYLSSADLKFALLYVKNCPLVEVRKKYEIPDR